MQIESYNALLTQANSPNSVGRKNWNSWQENTNCSPILIAVYRGEWVFVISMK